ncbi:MAG: hypothetical protein ACLGH0_07570, partial [Thermoanaerobaculia bacterium]
MDRRIAILVALLFAAACAPPVSDRVTIEFEAKNDSVVVTAESHFSTEPSEAARPRVEAARAAALSNTDPWAIRFARLTPEGERVIIDKERGVLERMTRSVRIRSSELQQVFSDSNITVNVLRSEDSNELALFPGSSTRATREQQLHFNAALTSWSTAVATYFSAVHDLYSYMDRNPERARYLFAAVLGERGDDGAEPLVTEEEQPLVQRVTAAMDEIAERMDTDEGSAATFAEEADLVFNPFPAHITVRVPGEVLSSDGFKVSDDILIIEPVDLFAALGELEGKWIEPDPLAALLRDETPTSDQLASRTRRSTT